MILLTALPISAFSDTLPAPAIVIIGNNNIAIHAAKNGPAPDHNDSQRPETAEEVIIKRGWWNKRLKSIMSMFSCFYEILPPTYLHFVGRPKLEQRRVEDR